MDPFLGGSRLYQPSSDRLPGFPGSRQRMTAAKATLHLSLNSLPACCHWRLWHRLLVAYPKSMLLFFLINGAPSFGGGGGGGSGKLPS